MAIDLLYFSQLSLFGKTCSQLCVSAKFDLPSQHKGGQRLAVSMNCFTPATHVPGRLTLMVHAGSCLSHQPPKPGPVSHAKAFHFRSLELFVSRIRSVVHTFDLFPVQNWLKAIGFWWLHHYRFVPSTFLWALTTIINFLYMPKDILEVALCLFRNQLHFPSEWSHSLLL